MKISLLISAIIIGLAAYFGLEQKEKIQILSSQWEEIKTSAAQKNIPTDPEAAFSSQRIRNNGTRIAQEKAVQDFATELADFAKKMKDAQSEGNSNQLDVQKEALSFMETLTRMSPAELKSLVKILAADTSLDSDIKDDLMRMSIMMSSAGNPETALTIILESSKLPELRNKVRRHLPMVMNQYAAEDPDAAAAWLLANEDQLGDEADRIKTQLISSIARNNFDSALSIIQTLGDEEKKNSYRTLGIGIKSGEQEKFLAALASENLSEEERKAALRSLTSSTLIREDFQAASAWLEGSELSATDKDAIVSGLSYYNVKDSTKEWLSWLSKEENQTESSDQATRQILGSWTSDNFVAAGEWLQTQDDGPSKITAVTTYAATLAPHEPAAAADWALTLPDNPERTQLLRTIHRSMQEKGLESAAAFAEQHQLTTAPAE